MESRTPFAAGSRMDHAVARRALAKHGSIVPRYAQDLPPPNRQAEEKPMTMDFWNVRLAGLLDGSADLSEREGFGRR